MAHISEVYRSFVSLRQRPFCPGRGGAPNRIIGQMSYVEVPHEQLSQEALEGLIEEFVTRDGTDYGERETPLDKRKAAVLKQLASGDAVIVFDEETQSATIVLREQLGAR